MVEIVLDFFGYQLKGKKSFLDDIPKHLTHNFLLGGVLEQFIDLQRNVAQDLSYLLKIASDRVVDRQSCY